ncbi:16S rRNA (adenine(1518)-N(6)/adenine(1519)-N(6))-dimethyltransferase RsmA [Lentilactobacillus senioris]|uniref:16S rRNA (adenine(1518)-N(6)/adenine(1519)-N(6))- dimethyltransferase RsmA n=1 Tax=Lentilactobacillus senioris TaxID=931534 RepID=UPI0022832842|nr:16S rRNA (adenine(1518)-N(6)/adenine(1519)-N(6))-dimethyltransferase RsmA [Lentilactobacillus senioris]MCY9807544.1 16S rRNA (adenine(1518)-N(6)/adenine(1519)-N(6))-dimethyltransferase RsmA [Lentilactobacillus senioris]
MNNMPPIASPVRTQAILNQYHLSAKKSLGQNFLTDLNVLNNIVEAAQLGPDDNVIEIGPGIGGLTELLAQHAKSVLAFEIDSQLIPVLEDTLAPYGNVTVLNQDILKANLPDTVIEYFGKGEKVKVVANLPYYITTPIVLDLIQNPVKFDQIVVMMQKEVAERLTATPRHKAYGSLSVIVQQLTTPEIAFTVPSSAFIPAPKVDSAIVSLVPAKPEEREQPYDQKKFIGFVRGCFMHRRKSLWNNLQGVFGKKPEVKAQITTALTDLEIDPSGRPEELAVKQFVLMTNKFHDLGLLN